MNQYYYTQAQPMMCDGYQQYCYAPAQPMMCDGYQQYCYAPAQPMMCGAYPQYYYAQTQPITIDNSHVENPYAQVACTLVQTIGGVANTYLNNRYNYQCFNTQCETQRFASNANVVMRAVTTGVNAIATGVRMFMKEQ